MWHQYAAIVADIGDAEPDRLTTALLERGLARIDTAMRMTDYDNPNSHFVRAQLLHHSGQISEALSEVTYAIHRHRLERIGDERRLSRFEGLRSRLLVERQGNRLLQEIARAQQDLEGSRSDQIQLLGVRGAAGRSLGGASCAAGSGASDQRRTGIVRSLEEMRTVRSDLEPSDTVDHSLHTMGANHPHESIP